MQWIVTMPGTEWKKAYDAMVFGEGVQESDPVEAIKNSYKNDVTDEFIVPTVIDKDGLIKRGRQCCYDKLPSRPCKTDYARLLTPDFKGI